LISLLITVLFILFATVYLQSDSTVPHCLMDSLSIRKPSVQCLPSAALFNCKLQSSHWRSVSFWDIRIESMLFWFLQNWVIGIVFLLGCIEFVLWFYWVSEDQFSNRTIEDCWAVYRAHRYAALWSLCCFFCSSSPTRESTHQNTMSALEWPYLWRRRNFP
jgi:hypothetical protein